MGMFCASAQARSHSGPVDEVAKSALGQGITVEPAGGAGYKSWEVIKGKQVRQEEKHTYSTMWKIVSLTITPTPVRTPTCT